MDPLKSTLKIAPCPPCTYMERHPDPNLACFSPIQCKWVIWIDLTLWCRYTTCKVLDLVGAAAVSIWGAYFQLQSLNWHALNLSSLNIARFSYLSRVPHRSSVWQKGVTPIAGVPAFRPIPKCQPELSRACLGWLSFASRWQDSNQPGIGVMPVIIRL